MGARTNSAVPVIILARLAVLQTFGGALCRPWYMLQRIGAMLGAIGTVARTTAWLPCWDRIGQRRPWTEPSGRARRPIAIAPRQPRRLLRRRPRCAGQPAWPPLPLRSSPLALVAAPSVCVCVCAVLWLLVLPLSLQHRCRAAPLHAWPQALRPGPRSRGIGPSTLR